MSEEFLLAMLSTVNVLRLELELALARVRENAPSWSQQHQAWLDKKAN